MSCRGVNFNFTCNIVSVFSIFMFIIWFICITVLTNNSKQQMYCQKTPDIKVLWVAFWLPIQEFVSSNLSPYPCCLDWVLLLLLSLIEIKIHIKIPKTNSQTLNNFIVLLLYQVNYHCFLAIALANGYLSLTAKIVLIMCVFVRKHRDFMREAVWCFILTGNSHNSRLRQL
jgi:hypothetical protein